MVIAPQRTRAVRSVEVLATTLFIFGVVGVVSLVLGVEKAERPAPDDALKMLLAGNERFAAQSARHPNTNSSRLKDTGKNGQHPFATIIACSDSRVPVERLFDRGIGDLFVIRVAGNVCDPGGLGSVEYGVEHLETPVLVVLGHTHCGAATAVCTAAKLHGHIQVIADKIKPAVEKAKKEHPNKEGEAVVSEAVRANVWQCLEDMLYDSPIVRERLEVGKVKVLGAIYDLDTGQVEWLGGHPEEKKLLARFGEKQVPAEPEPPKSPEVTRQHEQPGESTE